ncbi:MAG: iron chaperone, partial [Actinomycetota bacterium]
MAERKSAKKATQKTAKSTTESGKTLKAFTDEERAAMKERAQELKAAAGPGPRADKADGERAVLAKIAEMPQPDRAMGKRLHAIIKASAPALSPRLWYGMPAYAKDGKVVCFFQSAKKFNTRYASFGFSDEANLDEGALWPVAFAL